MKNTDQVSHDVYNMCLSFFNFKLDCSLAERVSDVSCNCIQQWVDEWNLQASHSAATSHFTFHPISRVNSAFSMREPYANPQTSKLTTVNMLWFGNQIRGLFELEQEWVSLSRTHIIEDFRSCRKFRLIENAESFEESFPKEENGKVWISCRWELSPDSRWETECEWERSRMKEQIFAISICLRKFPLHWVAADPQHHTISALIRDTMQIRVRREWSCSVRGWGWNL